MPDLVLGRDAELTAVDAFLAGLPSAPAALVLAGPAGVGKTTVLREAAERAVALGYAVLRTSPSPSDVRLAFAGLADLLGANLDVVLPELPIPQQRALGAALLLHDAPVTPPEPHVIAAALRSALRALAAPVPVVVVIDDVQWLDGPTESAVGFAFRRLKDERVGLLAAQRTDGPDARLPLELDRASTPAQVLPLGGLSLGAMHRMLHNQLGMSFSHQVLTRVHAESAGNPFIALEIARALARRGIIRVAGGSLPVPDTLAELVGERLRELPEAVADVLGVVAIVPDASVSRCLAAGVPAGDLDAAVLSGVVEVESGRVRFTHPLLASAVLGAIPPGRRSELHALAAATAADAEERARHLALATDVRSVSIAAELDDAARAAALRGAPATAAELWELAASKTPDDLADDRYQRLISAGTQLGLAGETRAAAVMLRQVADSAPPGPTRAEALARMGWNDEDDFETSTRLLEDALEEAGDVPALSATIRLFLADHWAILGDNERARAEMYLALDQAERANDPALLASALSQTFFRDWQSGREIDEGQLRRALDIERDLDSVGQLGPPSLAAGMYLLGTGRLDDARHAFERALARAQAEGIEYIRSDVLHRLSVIATKKGDPRRGAELAREGLEVAEQLDLDQLTSSLLHGCGLAALYLGQPTEVGEIARRAMDLSAKVGDQVYLRAHEALLGRLDVVLGDYVAAVARLSPLVAEPAAMLRRLYSDVMPELVEALVGVGDFDAAQVLLTDLKGRYRDPPTAAAAARCAGALAAARGDFRQAEAELDRALRLHEEVTRQPVEVGRTLLVLGGVRRRLRQRRAAREALEAAIATFDNSQAALWAARAREELARVSGRVAQAGELTATELRVAGRIASGMSNKAAAAELFVTVRTVESTLTKVYAKLGVTSRTQLASRLRDLPDH